MPCRFAPHRAAAPAERQGSGTRGAPTGTGGRRAGLFVPFVDLILYVRDLSVSLWSVRARGARVRHLVESSATKRLTAGQPAGCEPTPADGSVPCDRLGGVGGARGYEPAVSPEHLRKSHLIGPNRDQQQACGQGRGSACAPAAAADGIAHAAGVWHDSRTRARLIERREIQASTTRPDQIPACSAGGGRARASRAWPCSGAPPLRSGAWR